MISTGYRWPLYDAVAVLTHRSSQVTYTHQRDNAILLAARGEGYGGNLSTMVVPQEPQVQKLLGIPDFCAVAAVLALGKPTRRITKLHRKTVDEIATWERFDGPAYTLADEPRGNPDGGETRGTG
jgi:hypothetical protein